MTRRTNHRDSLEVLQIGGNLTWQAGEIVPLPFYLEGGEVAIDKNDIRTPGELGHAELTEQTSTAIDFLCTEVPSEKTLDLLLS
ncbi:hypothetical protein CEG14_19595 [Bordetella genomosp. 1]|uniref:Uncharacterized protein n=1 Tax=Bordetella genomosp. 1 TaxID=1395607 RepID=A0A261S6Q7_9BORD|nr:hypothetical protein CEG14_19595 [Bordetella genomosp. 1]